MFLFFLASPKRFDAVAESTHALLQPSVHHQVMVRHLPVGDAIILTSRADRLRGERFQVIENMFAMIVRVESQLDETPVAHAGGAIADGGAV